MQKIKIAVIGCSAIADKTLIPTIKAHPNFVLQMVGSRSEEKGQNFAGKYNCSYGTYHDVLNSADIDAVYVSLPTGLHFEWGKKVVQAGKHLLLEKPFTDTFTHAEEIVSIAQKNGVVAMEGLAYVYHPYFEKVKELLADGVIGDIRLIDASFGFPYLSVDDIRNKKDIGGGAILDNLIYPLSVCLELLGRDFASKSYNINFNNSLQIDDRGFLRLDWNNKSANINYGFGFFYKNKIEIWGDKGTMVIDRAFTKPATMIADIVISNSNETQTITVPPANQFSKMIDGFYNKIIGVDKSGRNENMDILSRMTIISEMYKNATGNI